MYNTELSYVKTLDELVTIRNKYFRNFHGFIVYCEETEKAYLIINDKILAITSVINKSVEGLKCPHCNEILSNKFIHGSIVLCEHCGSVYDIDNFNTDVK